jgi:hypothetical protein
MRIRSMAANASPLRIRRIRWIRRIRQIHCTASVPARYDGYGRYIAWHRSRRGTADITPCMATPECHTLLPKCVFRNGCRNVFRTIEVYDGFHKPIHVQADGLEIARGRRDGPARVCRLVVEGDFRVTMAQRLHSDSLIRQGGCYATHQAGMFCDWPLGMVGDDDLYRGATAAYRATAPALFSASRRRHITRHGLIHLRQPAPPNSTLCDFPRSVTIGVRRSSQ